jgi:hypothetical protein
MTTFSVNGTPPNGTIQTWVVPTTGNYRIRAVGAQGGDSYNGSGFGGKGADMAGDVALVAGQSLKILVGQKPPIYTPVNCNGGGGGTFVTLSNNTPLVVAGGGNGCNAYVAISNDATINNPAGNTIGGTGAAAGAGLTGNGTTDSWVSNAADAFIAGGQGAGPGYYNNYGGFGGGAGTHGNNGTSAVGGGGYSGGVAGTRGGGSYNSGTNQTNSIYAAGGSGFAEIVALNAPPSAPTLVAPADLAEIIAADPLLYDWVFNDPDAGNTQSEFALVRRKVAP